MTDSGARSAMPPPSEGLGRAMSPQRRPFWKRNAPKVPGRSVQASPIRENLKDQKPRKTLSFQDFEDNTSDAWDDAEDEIIALSEAKLSFENLLPVSVNHGKTASTNQASLPQRLEEVTGENTVPVTGDFPSQQASSTGKSEEVSSVSRQKGVGPGVGIRQSIPEDSNTAPAMPPVHVHPPPTVNTRHSEDTTESGDWSVPQSESRPNPPSRLSRQLGRACSDDKSLSEREGAKLKKVNEFIAGPNTDLDALKKMVWSGVPREARPTVWKLLSNYLPANVERRCMMLERKREEYFRFVKQYYPSRTQDNHVETWRQIQVDIPRMNSQLPFFRQSSIQEIYERVLFIWAIRHPASGYVQGINDLVTPFFVVFLSEYTDLDVITEDFDASQNLEEKALNSIEADCFWCLSKLLDGIQDNYTFAQPGIQLKVNALRELVKRIDAPLHAHLEAHMVEYLQFAFRWMNNLLMRELPLRCTIRLWDTYLAEPQGFSTFHLYVCAAFLIKWRKDLLRERDFQGLMLHLQNLPTIHWGDDEIGLILAEAYRLKYMFADAPNHLNQKKPT
ncbi:TBC1 domain family member 22B-like isoform X3 [Branchiostoma floridae]|uniref:TBC1 domain family member 22B-like isoform X3 n=1 Tax=Branchiostoma floridae TaxID=7739 RepID=A0A9J7MPU3_BRAFL|nr:TBC1 domain family member 22B-like isoform X3 [Branchiostoma floridae]